MARFIIISFILGGVPSEPRVVMLRTRPFHPEPRGFKEAKTLVKAGYNVHVIAWDRLCELPKNETLNNISIRRVHLPAGYNIFFRFAVMLPIFWVFSFFSILRKRPDIIHCADLDTLPVGVFAKKILMCGLVYDVYENYPGMVRGSVPPLIVRCLAWLDKTLSRVADLILIVWDSFQARYPRSVLVPNVPEGEGFERVTPARRADVRKKYDLDEKFVIGYIGVFMKGRGIEQVIEAVKGMDDVIFLIGGFGQEEKTIHDLAEGVKESRLIGFVPPENVPEILSACDAIVEIIDPKNENYSMGMGNKVFEAMNAGLPVIVSRGTVGEKFVRDVGCGVAVEYGNIEELRGVIRRFVSCREDARSLGERGRSAARERWRWEVIENGLLERYNELKERIKMRRESRQAPS